jgi:hypothetical protein
MLTFLTSHLSVEECIARLENAKKKDDIPFSNAYRPPYGKLVGNTFRLQVNIGRYLPYMYGEFSKSAEGTLITCSMEVAKSTRKFNILWSIVALPFFSFMAVFRIIDGVKNGFSTTHFVAILIGIGIPIFYYYMQKTSSRRTELDKQELLDFLRTTLEARLRCHNFK